MPHLLTSLYSLVFTRTPSYVFVDPVDTTTTAMQRDIQSFGLLVTKVYLLDNGLISIVGSSSRW